MCFHTIELGFDLPLFEDTLPGIDPFLNSTAVNHQRNVLASRVIVRIVLKIHIHDRVIFVLVRARTTEPELLTKNVGEPGNSYEHPTLIGDLRIHGVGLRIAIPLAFAPPRALPKAMSNDTKTNIKTG